MQNELQKLSSWTEVYKNIYITYNSFCILIGAVIIMVGSKYSVEMFSVCFTCRYAHYNLIIFTTFSKDPFTTTSRLCIGTRSCLLYYCSHIFWISDFIFFYYRIISKFSVELFQLKLSNFQCSFIFVTFHFKSFSLFNKDEKFSVFETKRYSLRFREILWNMLKILVFYVKI